MKKYEVDQRGYYGRFGGAFVPEVLHANVENLRKAYLREMSDPSFQDEFQSLLRDYVGRPSPLYLARRLSERYGAKIYLKREDLNHTGAHKINNTIGQILLARRMGKTRIIAETGAGQHGVATATVCALMDMECIVYMGATDIARQRPNVEKMEMLGARVVPVESGNKTLKDATNEAIRDWCCNPRDTYYIIGSTVGPHPYPDMVARFQSVISQEIRRQLLEKEGRETPDCVIACVGGGSNAAGAFYHFINEPSVKLVAAEAGGLGVDTGYSAATIHLGRTDNRTLLGFRRVGLSGHRPVACVSFGRGPSGGAGSERRRGSRRSFPADRTGGNNTGSGVGPCTGGVGEKEIRPFGCGGGQRVRTRGQRHGNIYT